MFTLLRLSQDTQRSGCTADIQLHIIYTHHGKLQNISHNHYITNTCVKTHRTLQTNSPLSQTFDSHGATFPTDKRNTTPQVTVVCCFECVHTHVKVWWETVLQR